MSKLTKVLIPSYIKNFKCIGGACEDSCCIGWNIDIDKLTYRKYFRTNNSEMKNQFKKYVNINNECEFEEVDYGFMKIKDNKWCPFLNKNKLCNIYSNLGEDYLSNVCHSYPRIYNVLNGVYEISLYMSCPEAVRMLFKNKEPIKFIDDKIELDKHIIHSYVDTKDKEWKGSGIKRLKEIRSNSIKVLQNRENPIDKRLIILGEKLKPANCSTLEVDNIFIFQLNFFKDVINTLNVKTDVDSPLFIEYTSNINLLKNASDYQDIMINIVKPFVKDNSYLFEHYLVNSVFQSNFPFNVNQDQFEGFLILIVRYTFIRFYLSGLAIKNGKLNKEDVINMVQVHSKIINHHDTFIPQTLKNIIDRDFDNLDFASILLSL